MDKLFQDIGLTNTNLFIGGSPRPSELEFLRTMGHVSVKKEGATFDVTQGNLEAVLKFCVERELTVERITIRK